MSLDILGIGANALNAFQLGAAISSKNIAGSSDPNYCREAVSYTNMIGGGVDVSVKRLSDQFLSFHMNRSQSQASKAETSAALSSSIDQFITGLNGSDEAGAYNLLNKSMQSVFNALSDLSTNVSESTRQSVLSKAATLTNTMNTIGKYLDDQVANVNNKIGDSVSQINSLAKQIASLNARVAQTSEAPSADLLNQRDRLVNELSQFSGVKTVEKNGQLNVYMQSGQELVNGGSAATLTAKKDAYGNNIEVYLNHTRISGSKKLSGSLGGLIETRNGIIASAQQKMGRMAATLATVLNEQNKAGYLSDGTPGSNIFDPMQFTAASNESNTGTGNISITFDSANISQLKDASYEVMVTSDGKYQIENTKTGEKVIADNFPISLDGINLSALGTMQPGDKFLVNPLKQAARSMALVDNIQPDDLAASSNPDGSGTDNFNAMADLADKDVMDNGDSNFNQGLATIFSYIGGEAQQVAVEQRAANAALTQAKNDVQSVSGVNVQEEYTSLMHFQQSYTAATKIISTYQQLFNSVISVIGG